MGPGIVGTGTRLGFSGIEVGPVLDAGRRRSAGCRSRACASPSPTRVSATVGLSHHTLTALRLACRERVLVPVPCVGGDGGGPPPRRPRRARGSTGCHELVDVDPPDVLALFARAGLEVNSMGRPAAADPVLFQAAAAAGVVAVDRMPGRAPGIVP